MNLIIPMAGEGKRMRPHTLSTPKPLMPVAGKPIVARLVEGLRSACKVPIQTIGFVVNNLEAAVQEELTQLAAGIGAQAKFYGQEDKKGTAHAVVCASELLQGPVIVAFGDTLFMGNFSLDMEQESVIWTKKVDDPSAFGVVTLDDQGVVTGFVEKPTRFVSDQAIIGIYYFREGAQLKQPLQKVLNEGPNQRGEYELTGALTTMLQNGVQFTTQAAEEWLDCGTQEALIHANQRFLAHLKEDKDLISPTAQLHESVIIPPVYLGDHVSIKNTLLGPYVAVGSHSTISNARIENSIIQTHSTVTDATLDNSILGNHVCFEGNGNTVSLGDYTAIMNKANKTNITTVV
jgi:glucose-1-phosphate thymidylyltransferase